MFDDWQLDGSASGGPLASNYLDGLLFPSTDPSQTEPQSLYPPPLEGSSSSPATKEHVRRPPNAFILFRMDFCKRNGSSQSKSQSGRGQARGDRGDELSRWAGSAWGELSLEEKQGWEELSAERRREHKRKYPNFKYHKARPQPRRRPAKKTRERKEGSDSGSQWRGGDLEASSFCWSPSESDHTLGSSSSRVQADIPQWDALQGGSSVFEDYPIDRPSLLSDSVDQSFQWLDHSIVSPPETAHAGPSVDVSSGYKDEFESLWSSFSDAAALESDHQFGLKPQTYPLEPALDAESLGTDDLLAGLFSDTGVGNSDPFSFELW
ncbi:hypothetical protein AAF712_013540 [Marasmius tenuissimus]|uniref:HMG box domain-containing protein n=1 Tax=Marasmius tenuissimus TaxID=585030 RepID=A0ABR2ZEN6_9AGAR